jgi:hypothetical protein
VPTFLYHYANIAVSDRCEPSAERGLKRTLQLTAGETGAQRGELWWRVQSGKTLRREQPRSYTSPARLTAIVPEQLDRAGVLRDSAGGHEWLVPIEIDGETTLHVEYRW